MCFDEYVAMLQIRERAKWLPSSSNTTPQEICVHIHNKREQERQKASAPSDAPTDNTTDAFASSVLYAVSTDMKADDSVHQNARNASAFVKIAAELSEPAEAQMQQTLHMTHGPMLDQITPLYMMVMFPFMFPNGSGCPDLVNKPHRNKADVFEVDLIKHWSKCIMQRVEGHFRRDLTFPHALWQLCFKSTINMAPNLREAKRAAASTVDGGEREKYDARDFAAAATEIVTGLRGKYLTQNGSRREVNGDMQRLYSADPPLSSLAISFLKSYQATGRLIEGTQEIRTLMRKTSEAFHTSFGTSIFVTFSPTERSNTVMIRCCRTAPTDPLRKYDADIARWTDRDVPSLQLEHTMIGGDDDDVSINVPLDAILGALPNMQSRQKLLAKDPLATVYGFGILVRITLRALFGVRVCSECPDCNTSKTLPGCCDEFGSVGYPEGGMCGVIEAYHGSIEQQGATGSPHTHMSLFIARMHQHMKMRDIMDLVQEQGASLVKQFERFVNHATKASYNDVDRFHKMQPDIEKRHEENRNALELAPLVYGPREEKDERMSAEQWKETHERDADAIRMITNHHYHPKNEEGEEIVPRWCKSKTSGDQCKHHFPKPLLDKFVVLCEGLLKQHGLPNCGQQNKTASMLPKRNDAYANGAPDICLRCNRFNTDLQIMDRLPLTKETHSELCTDPKCIVLRTIQEISENPERESSIMDKLIQESVQAAEQSQRSSQGYYTDYVTKRQPLSMQELTHFINGYHQLCHEMKSGANNEKKSIVEKAKKMVRRLLNDCIGRATGRVTQEVTNIVVNRKEHDKTAAESFKSCLTVSVPTRQFINEATGLRNEHSTMRRLVLSNDKSRVEIAHDSLLGIVYGQRGSHRNVWTLSVYELMRWYEIMPVTYPPTLRRATDNPGAFHAVLTQQGQNKVRQRSKETLSAGSDYEVPRAHREGHTGNGYWIALSAESSLRNYFVLQKRKVAILPQAESSSIRSNPDDDEHLMTMSILFRPWVSFESDAMVDNHMVVHKSDLIREGSTWKAEFMSYIDKGVPTESIARTIQNFMAVHSVREGPSDLPGSAKDAADGVDVNINNDSLKEVLQTAMSADRDVGPEYTASLYGDQSRDVKHHVDMTAANKFNEMTIEDIKRISTLRSDKKPVAAQPQVHNDAARSQAVAESKDVKHIVMEFVKRWGEKTKKYPEQYQVIRIVAARVLQEHRENTGELPVGQTEPIKLFVTGPPGTGKSFVTDACRDLFTCLGWTHGEEFAFTGFQASTAVQVKGFTIHRGDGLSFDSSKSDRSSTGAINYDKNRWKFIDEVSLVPAALYARAEEKARRMVPDAASPSSYFKYAPNGTVRDYGGINVVVVGDFYQLPPSHGAISLANVPTDLFSRFQKSMTNNSNDLRGIELMWADDMQMVELITQVRQEGDFWYRDVLTQMRGGCLSDNYHDFIHGNDTTIPGSYVEQVTTQRKSRYGTLENVVEHGVLLCENTNCIRTWTKNKTECGICQKHRKSRTLVVTGADDPRYDLPNFRKAVNLVSYNDNRCDMGQKRAVKFARESNQSIAYVIADDRTEDTELIKAPDLKDRKKMWLTYHDRKCANMPGKIPLAVGLKLSLTQHVSHQHNLLRYRQGTVVGWVCDPRESSRPKDVDCYVLKYMPLAIIVHFDLQEGEDPWQIADLKPGHFVVRPWKAEKWYLDQGKTKGGAKATKLIKRKQFPLTTGDSATINSRQGFTEHNGILVSFANMVRGHSDDDDLNSNTAAIGAYVAFSRTKSHKDVLCMNPFPKELFQKGPMRNVDLLLMKHRKDLRFQDELEKYEEAYIQSEIRKAELRAEKRHAGKKAGGEATKGISKNTTGK